MNNKPIQEKEAPPKRSTGEFYKLESSDKLQLGKHQVGLIERERSIKTEEVEGDVDSPSNFVLNLLDISMYDQVCRRKRQRNF